MITATLSSVSVSVELVLRIQELIGTTTGLAQKLQTKQHLSPPYSTRKNTTFIAGSSKRDSHRCARRCVVTDSHQRAGID